MNFVQTHAPSSRIPEQPLISIPASTLRPFPATAASAETSTIQTVAPHSGSLDRLASEVFVGRECEMDVLREDLTEALAGRGRVVVLTGEPGIGKTRTATELTAYARWQGARVLRAHCHEGEGAPPFWPWVQLLRTYVSECPPARLRTEMGPGAADIAQIIITVRDRLPDLPTPPQLEPGHARFRLFDSV